ncbi:hypothetical protein [Mycobacterium haemophilum]|uniref:Uncharacterized protein n=1 Tax=Mycobacterium haemophilum TaxID=29311 RepID=A0A0I9UD71_9MYCO|nr:hypothetical protein [Mycobacterium haemophilum]KLO26248.1 hypothetical protein ABH39_18290 [Mycobacterium haemophilum]KLO37790.1 hypothetical protein ABH38_07520 [Mycobacterium haemophilum]KLO39483.1 hypothetical protein ABH37_17990 [Mycobacterium haemophilum]KLO55611.1 hypothetical protein ABH36_06475 [Mycobacterium haemophilum]
MTTIWTYLRATAVVVGSSAALLTGGIAHADTMPAPAPIPAPALNIPQQLISSAANAPQILQNLATALGATPPVTAPSAPGISFPGLAPAAATVPTSPAATLPSSFPGIMAPAATNASPATAPTIPGLSALIPGLTAPAPATPATPAIPGLPASIPGVTGPATPAAAVPASTPGVPQAKVDMPAMPFLPVNVPPQISLPGDLQALASGAPAVAAPVSAPTLLSALP